jgi:hypothetical protein
MIDSELIVVHFYEQQILELNSEIRELERENDVIKCSLRHNRLLLQGIQNQMMFDSTRLKKTTKPRNFNKFREYYKMHKNDVEIIKRVQDDMKAVGYVGTKAPWQLVKYHLIEAFKHQQEVKIESN